LYIEQKQLLKKIDKFEQANHLELTQEQKIQICSNVSKELDKTRILDFDEFNDLVNHNISLEELSDIDFNDEIVSITELDYDVEMVDFNVTNSGDDKLFYANDILVHNSAVNNTDDADNSNISDSIGTAMTADFMLFLLQDEEMKEKHEIVCKVTKNRFTGKTDTWMMNIDYEHMQFAEMKISDHDSTNASDIINIDDVTGTKNNGLMEDYGIITAEKQKHAEQFAKQEITDIYIDDVNKIKETPDAFTEDLQDVYKSLGLE